MQTLSLHLNQLSGTIPPALGTLSKLTSLSLYGNALTGTIPLALGSLSQLTSLLLRENQLSGAIPRELAGLRKLRELALRNNQLTGTVPPELGQLVALEGLSLSANQLTGPIPTQLGNLANLDRLWLANNRLSGPVPADLTRLVKLQRLELQGNMLAGALPAAMTQLTALLAGGLDLRWNALSTDNTALRAFLASRQNGGDWEGSQTLAPAGVTAARVSSAIARVSWMPIAYFADPGGYRVEQGSDAAGPLTLVATAPDKAAGSLDIPAPPAGTTAYFVVTAFTSPHAANGNTVTAPSTAPAVLPPYQVVHLRRALRSR